MQQQNRSDSELGALHLSSWQERIPASILWGSSQAGNTILLASSGWMVSGLSGSPLLNGMLPAFGIIPLFLGLKQNRNGYFFQIISATLLIGLAWLPIESGPSKSIVLVGTFAALLLHGTGKALSSRSLKKDLLDRPGSSSEKLRVGQDLGFFIGNLITAMLFPAIRQFLPGLLLLLPITSSLNKNTQGSQPIPAQERPPLHGLSCLQGLVIGSLFALLALWVREIDGGKCFDFAMVLAAYRLGRPLMIWMPNISASTRYGLLIPLLIFSQISPVSWLSVALFIPIGALISSSELMLINGLTKVKESANRWRILESSSAIGGFIGSIGLGLLCQILGLAWALPLVCVGLFSLALLHLRQPPTLQASA